MKKLIHKIRLKFIHLLGGDTIPHIDKSPIKIIERRPTFRTIVSCKKLRSSYREYIPIDRIRDELAIDIGRQIIETVGIQTSTDFQFDENIYAYRVKVDIIEKMDEREVSE